MWNLLLTLSQMVMSGLRLVTVTSGGTVPPLQAVFRVSFVGSREERKVEVEVEVVEAVGVVGFVEVVGVVRVV